MTKETTVLKSSSAMYSPLFCGKCDDRHTLGVKPAFLTLFGANLLSFDDIMAWLAVMNTFRLDVVWNSVPKPCA